MKDGHPALNEVMVIGAALQKLHVMIILQAKKKRPYNTEVARRGPTTPSDRFGP